MVKELAIKHPRIKILVQFSLTLIGLLLCIELGLQWSNTPNKAEISVYSGDGSPNNWFSIESGQVVPTYQHQTVGQFNKTAKGSRIAVLGGSVVHGGSINMTADKEFPALLDIDASVHNLANPSLDSHDQLAILEELAQYHMDAWIVSTGHNDFGNTYLHQRYVYWPEGILGKIGRFKENLKLTHLVRQWLGAPSVNSAKPQPDRQFSAPKINDDQKYWALLHFKMNIDAIVNLAKASKTPLILIVPPRSLTKAPVGDCQQGGVCASDLWNRGMEEKDKALLSNASDADTIPFRVLSEAQQHLKDKAKYDHVWVVDAESLLPQDREGLGPDISLFQDHVHFKMAGHQEMATLLSTTINEAIRR